MAKLEKIISITIALGTALLALALIFPSTESNTTLTVFAVLSFLLFTTYALKIISNAETYYLFSLLRTKRFIGFIEKISKTRIWDVLADIGIVIGFGTIAVDYLYGRQKSKGKRALLAIASAATLFLFFFFVFGLLFVATSPGTMIVLLFFSASFAIGGLMLFAVAALIWQGLDIIAKILAGKTPCPGVAPIIPGVQVPNVPTAFTPPIYIWIAFVVLLVVHEFSHGALIKRASAKIKSVGLLLAGIFPIGAFVEPDEEEIKSKPERQQLRIYAIGPAANLYSIPLIILFLLLFGLAITPILAPHIDSLEKNMVIRSAVVSKVLDNYEICGNTVEMPAKGEIEKGWVLLQYNGYDLNTVYDFKLAFAGTDANATMLFRTKEGTLVEKTIERNQYGQLGIQVDIDYEQEKGPTQEYINIMLAISVFSTFFGWLLLLSFAIAVVNFLPIEPFDGGKAAKIILLPYFRFLEMNKKDTEKFIGRLFLWVVAGLLLLNALPLLL